jgi:hypothetical protein
MRSQLRGALPSPSSVDGRRIVEAHEQRVALLIELIESIEGCDNAVQVWDLDLTSDVLMGLVFVDQPSS